MRMLVSDMAGRANIQIKGEELGFDLSDRDLAARITDRVKDAEAAGYTYEAADASFELLLRRELDQLPEFFTVQSWRVFTQSITGATGRRDTDTECTVRLTAKGQSQRVVGEGNGPVNALDHALRSALAKFYPEIRNLELIDYKVRILDAAHGTDAVTRVLIETSDGTTSWTTIGVAANILEASWDALVESVTYGLIRAGITAR
jgi:2-isopropylmalate synthase